MTARVSLQRITVSDGNLKKAALRLLNQSLVSTEMQYVKHVLGASATQVQIDEKVLAVRQMAWSSIVLPD
jgi:hypothetical protein